MKKLLLLSILTILLTTNTFKAVAQVTSQDSLALVAIYNNCGGNSWINNTNWLTGNVPTWYGVYVTGDRVTALNLNNNNLIGSIPTEIGNLTGLTSLELYDNNLTGEIIQEITSLTTLTTLDLDRNNLTGTIPATIGNLTNLTTLWLGGNGFTGSIPIEIGNLTNLTMLGIYENHTMTGTIPAEISALTSLTELYLSFNNLTGAIPDLSALTSLESVFIDDNSFTFADIAASQIGEFELNFWYWPQADIAAPTAEIVGENCTLTAVSVGHESNTYKWYKNDIEIPDETTNQLTILYNATNEGSYYCVIENTDYFALTLKTETYTLDIPTSQKDSLALVAIYNSCGGADWSNNTNWLTGNVSTWYGVTVSVDDRVTALNLNNNNLTGSIPNLSSFTDLIDLRLEENSLSGAIHLSTLTSLESLHIYNNSFSFADIAASQIVPGDFGSGFMYNPQADIAAPTVEIAGENYNLTAVPVGHETNTYKWYKNEVEIPGKTTNQITIPYDVANEGNYYCKIENIDYSGLTLQTKSCALDMSGSQRDSLALVVIYNALNGDNWSNKNNWLTGNMSTWYGVTVTSDRVTALRLVNNNLTGSIPTEIGSLTELTRLELYYNDLTGEIPVEIRNLTNLTTLNLYSNHLTGSIPDLSTLTSLTDLSLQGNYLTGIPDLSTLVNLEKLGLCGNNLSGSILNLSTLVNLEILTLCGNNLSGALPDLSALTSLTILNLSDNSFSFSDIAASQIAHDEVANFDYSQQANLTAPTIEITGENRTLTAPAGHGGTAYQWYKNNVAISGETTNQLTTTYNSAGEGDYYCEITNTDYPDLTLKTETFALMMPANQQDSLALVAIYNALNGDNWSNNTNWLTGDMFTWNGATVTDGRVTELIFNSCGNNLFGEIPAEIGNLAALTKLELSSTRISGEIPAEIGNLDNLIYLDLSYNNLTGEIPAEICSLTNLTGLRLSENELTGIIPTVIGNLTKLTKLDLYGNELTGVIPTEIGSLGSLKYLLLYKNNLTGVIPAEIGSFQNLQFLYLQQNKLSGIIPAEIGSLQNLKYLNLSDNNLTGAIPTEINDLLNLIVCYISDNSFTFTDLANITQESLFSYSPQANLAAPTIEITGGNCTITVPTEHGGNIYKWYKNNVAISGETTNQLTTTYNSAGEDNYYCEITNTDYPDLTLKTETLAVVHVPTNQQDSLALVAIYNSCGGDNWNTKTNWFTGTVPEWYGVTVKEGRVTKLELPGNNMTGTIPTEIGNLTNLTSLSLSENNLTGAIPAEIVNLENLDQLYLSDNNLSGTIPVGISSSTVSLSDNSFTFAELAASQMTEENTPFFYYYPQKKLVAELTETGENYTLTVPEGHAGNAYAWFKNEEEIINGTTRQLTIPNTNDGDFYCEITNSLYPWLTLTTETFTVVHVPTNQQDSLALVAIYNSCGGDNWNTKTNWFTGTVPEWYGVTVKEGLVTKLELPGNNMTGTIPTEIGNLTNLTSLSLSENNLTGAIPAEIVNLENLDQLYLSDNNLSGIIPVGISSSTVSLNDNSFTFAELAASQMTEENTPFFYYYPQKKLVAELTETGENYTLTVPEGHAGNAYTWFKNDVEIVDGTTRQLTIPNTSGGDFYCRITNALYLNLVLETETLAVIQPVNQQDSLALVAIYNSCGGADWTKNTNWLTGIVPSWHGVTVEDGKVVGLYLDKNELTGAIPTEIGGLVNLKELDLSQNKLSGAIPAEIGSLTSLTVLVLYFNNLTGEIPTEINSLTSLTELWLTYNDLTGEIPAGISNLTSLIAMDLGYNDLIGTIPAEIGSLTNLEHLSFDNNNLTGTIPAEIGNLINLQELHLSYNKLTGTIPAEIGNLTNLQELDISDNQLSGAIPDFSSLSNLELYIGDNLFTFADIAASTITPYEDIASFWYWPQANLAVPTLTENGENYILTVPAGHEQNTYKWFENSVEISGQITNQLTIPNTNTSNYYCEIRNNLYSILKLTTKTLPLLTASAEDKAALIAIYNSCGGDNWKKKTNWLTEGTEVHEWYGVTVENGRVTKLELSENGLTGVIPTEIGSLTGLTYMYLGSNDLSGAIPAEIGNLTNLTMIYLADNDISGAIPAEIDNLTSLTHLTLYRNKLTSIPHEIGSLENLTFLHLSGNELSGMIPVEIGSLANLEGLHLSENDFTGIPAEIGGLTNLTDLSINGNKLSTIPAEIGSLTSLEDLYLYNNDLAGEIPAEIANLTNLRLLGLSNNQLSGAIPNLSIEYLYINNNSFVFADIAASTIEHREWGLNYSSQAALATPIVTKIDGNCTLTIPEGHEQNQYTWYRDSVMVGGQNTRQLTILNSNTADFYCEITNSLYPALTLSTKSITIENVQPTVTLASTATSPVNSSFALQITFSEEVTGFTVEDITVTNGAASNLTTTDSIAFTATITPNADSQVTTVTVAASVSSDLAGNPNVAAIPIFAITYDATAPTVTLASDASGAVSSYFDLQITFSEAVTGFVADNITVVNGAASNFATTGNTAFTARIQAVTDGAVTVDINAGVAADLAGNDNTAATQFSITYVTSPTSSADSLVLVAIYNACGGENWTTGAGIAAGGAWLVGDVSTWDGVTLINGRVAGLDLAGKGLTGELPPEIGSLDGLGALDLSGNNITGLPDEIANLTGLSSLSLASNSLSFEDMAKIPDIPGFQFPAEKIALQTQPTVTKADGNRILTLPAGHGGNSFQWYKDGAAISGETGEQLVIASSEEGSYTCIIINSDYPGVELETGIPIDNIQPIVTLLPDAGSIVNSAFALNITFSEAVTGFTLDDVIVTNGVASAFAGSGSEYIATITPINNGAVTIDVNENVAEDIIKNGNAVATQFATTYDGTAPTVTLSSTVSGSISSAFTLQVTFSEAVTDFVLADITVANGTASGLTTTDNIAYTATITPTTDGAVTIDLAQGIAQDAARNGNVAATQFTITFTGIKDLKQNGISIYPVPAKDNFEIISSKLFGNARIDIYNMSGACVYTKEIASPFTEKVVVSDFNPGIHILKMKIGNEVITSKITVIR